MLVWSKINMVLMADTQNDTEKRDAEYLAFLGQLREMNRKIKEFNNDIKEKSEAQS